AYGVAFAHAEFALQGEVENVVARPGNSVAARVTEREGRGRGERVRIEEMIGGALAARKRDTLAGDHIGPVQGAGVSEVEREVERRNRRAVLQRHRAGERPSSQHGPGGADRRDSIHVSGSDAAAGFGKGKAALQPQV